MTMNTVHDRLNQLTDPDAHVRLAAVRAIAGSPRLYVHAVAPLLPLVRDPEPKVRPVAVAALREIGDPRAIPALSAMLTTGNSALRKAALIALLRIDSPHTEQHLTTVLQDNTCSPGLHLYAVKESAKRKMVGPLLIAMYNQKLEVAVKAVEKLGVRAYASSPLVSNALLSLLMHPMNGLVRETVIDALVKLRDQEAIKPLMALLADKDASVRSKAAEALGKLGGAQVTKKLLVTLTHDDPRVRTAAATALGQRNDARALEPLLAALTDEDLRVRGAASEGLDNLRRFWTAELFLPALAHANAHLRLKAARALSDLNDARAVEPLMTFLTDEDASIRYDVACRLNRLHDLRAVEPLIARLQDEDVKVRCGALHALARLRDTRAVEPLITALNDSDVTVRRLAIEALGELRDLRARKPLIALLHDPLLRGSAYQSLHNYLGGVPKNR